MSLYIDVDKVSSVLIGIAWHDVSTGTFTVDKYDFACEDDPAHDTGLMGFQFQNPMGEWIYGPITSIIALISA